MLGLLYAILDRFVFSGASPLVGILLMAFIIFAVLSLAYVILREDLKEERQKLAAVDTTPEFIPPAVTARLIEEREFLSIPAVTEDTTVRAESIEIPHLESAFSEGLTLQCK